MLSDEIKRRLETPVDGSIPLKDRLDVERLRAALKEPLYMDLFLADRNEMPFWHGKGAQFNSCGTIGCIAGNVLLNEFPADQRVGSLRKEHWPERFAQQVLRLTPEEADELFFVGYPSETPGTAAYADAVSKLVTFWLGKHGIEFSL